eukprot:1178089-Amphidinium_carterae.1
MVCHEEPTIKSIVTLVETFKRVLLVLRRSGLGCLRLGGGKTFLYILNRLLPPVVFRQWPGGGEVTIGRINLHPHRLKYKLTLPQALPSARRVPKPRLNTVEVANLGCGRASRQVPPLT